MENSEDRNRSMQQSYERKEHLRNLLDRIETIGESEETGINAVKDVNYILNELKIQDENLSSSDKIENPDETLLDAMVINSASQLLLKCVNAINISSNVYDSNEFANNLIKALDNDNPEEFASEDLLKLMVDANNIIREIPVFAPLYGSYDITKVPEVKVEKQKVKRQTREHVEKKELIRVVNSDKEETSIEETINFMLNILTEKYEKRHRKPINYYKFVIDTNDFGQTVQNIFYTSFMVRDGKVKLDIDEDNNPILVPISRDKLKKFRNEGGETTQIITSISMEQWKEFSHKGYLQQHKEKFN